MTDLLDFDAACDLLLPLGMLQGPSELHGFLSGQLCGGARLGAEHWWQKAKEMLDIDVDFDQESILYFAGLYQETLDVLKEDDYAFQLLLPDDESDLEQRVMAMSQWCHGFLIGFGSAGIDPNTAFSKDQADGLRDLAAIVQAGMDDELDEDEQEADYIELVEYVRVLALNFFEDNKTAKESDKTVH